ncbi:MAG: hypothetical protein ACTSUF_03715 [Candidatus Heimdallarchaeaceae archaeon]
MRGKEPKIYGYVSDAETGNMIVGATVTCDTTGYSATTDIAGYYELDPGMSGLSLPITATAPSTPLWGYEPQTQHVDFDGVNPVRLDFQLAHSEWILWGSGSASGNAEYVKHNTSFTVSFPEYPTFEGDWNSVSSVRVTWTSGGTQHTQIITRDMMSWSTVNYGDWKVEYKRIS